ncbi:MAG: putative pterin-4-alpha-carbinolamine dehydratase [Alphaproteobacteria bacterium MarineAlpha5_Bin9]|nr:MAG: putative pterin-4-alpha-carbinolamine dehydratase [Alphaproteobacteria bacterium MarineAlpha5_Bin9]|tara:strand:+ start:5406 stop:5741 length:336 start_codon:yes stop_codon:yes gene_type:complete
MNNFKNQKCKPCSTKTPKMENSEIRKNLFLLNNWALNDSKDMIYKKFKFKNFSDSLNFVNLVGALAENEGHHPDISLGYGYCLIMIHTHAIKGLSLNDFILATKIDTINLD